MKYEQTCLNKLVGGGLGWGALMTWHFVSSLTLSPTDHYLMFSAPAALTFLLFVKHFLAWGSLHLRQVHYYSPPPRPLCSARSLNSPLYLFDMFDMFFRQGRIRKGLLAPSFHSFTLSFHFFRALPNTFFSSHRGICIFFFLSCLLHKKVEINFMKHGQHNSVIVYFRD